MGNRTIGMIGVLSCLLGVNAVSYAGEAGNDVSKIGSGNPGMANVKMCGYAG